MKVALFRWKALGPLLAVALLGGVAWWLFGDALGRRAFEAAGTAIIGAKVDVDRMHLALLRGKVELQGLTVASPSESLKNVLQANQLVADLDLLPLLEKKVVIDRLAATGMRFGTPRATSGFVQSSSPSLASQVKANVTDWAAHVDVPALQLTSGKVALPRLSAESLGAVRAVQSLGRQIDSSKAAWDTALASLHVQQTVDSAAAMANRLKGAKPTDLVLLNDARRTLTQVKATHDRVVAVERGVTSGAASLRTGLAGIDSAKQRDVARARSLLKLPGLDAASIGAALFGPSAVGKFQRALYWYRLGREYMPPGLLPRSQPGPRRHRRAGTTVHFPREHELPAFLLRDGDLSFQLGTTDSRPKIYSGHLTGLTTAPTLYGRPTTLTASAPDVAAGAVLDHVRTVSRDSAGAALSDVALPALDLPGLPLRLDPGRGRMEFTVALSGDNLSGRWAVHATAIKWVGTRGAGVAPSSLERLVTQAVSGIGTLDLETRLSGTYTQPRISVSSNLDRAIADRLRAIVGDQVAAAERGLRAQVDGIVDRQVAPLRAKVTSETGDATGRVGDQKSRLDQARQALEQRLRQLTPGFHLP